MHYTSTFVRKIQPQDYKRTAFVYEAGPTGFGLYDDISGEGYGCLVVTPSAVPTARGKRVRTNRLDSRKLAVQLRGGSSATTPAITKSADSTSKRA